MRPFLAAIGVCLFGLTGPGAPLLTTGSTPRAALTIETYVADSAAFNVVSTIIAGATEAILVDVQFTKSDATKVADLIAEKGVTLKAVFITHAHDDHFTGLDVIHKRFPDAPVYMTAGGLREFTRTARRAFMGMRQYMPAQTPDTLETPELLPGNRLTVDGQSIDVVPDVQGDALVPSNSYLWIPSLRAVVAGDIVFNGVHVWLANSTATSRQRWLGSLDRLAALHPQRVVAGHKRSADTPDSPEAIAATRAYLVSFDVVAATAATADDLVARMRTKYPTLALANILVRAARTAIPSD